MRGPASAPKRAPTPQVLRQMMANAAAAATSAASAAVAAAAATATANVKPAPQPDPIPLAEVPRARPPTSSRLPAARRHSINQLPPLISNDVMKGAPLPPAENGVRMQRINEMVSKLKETYEHPPNAAQIETDTLHQIRAILYMNRAVVTQSFISHVSGVSQGSLSHFVRGLFKGNQANVDLRLEKFVQQFAAGNLDTYLEEIRNGTRSAARPLHFPSVHPAASLSSHAPIPPPPPPQLHPAPWARPATGGDLTPSEPPASASDTPVKMLAPARNESTPAKQSTPQSMAEQAAQHVAEQIAGEIALQGQRGTIAQADAATIAASSVDGHRRRSSDASLGLAVDDTSGRPVRTRRRRSSYGAPLPRQVVPKALPPVFPKLPEEPGKITSVMAVDRAFHESMGPTAAIESSDAEPLLVPIEIFFSHGQYVLHTFTQWDVNERELSPEVAADRLRRSRGLPTEFTEAVAGQIRRALFDAGVLCVPPPATKPVENRRLLRFSVELEEGDHTQVLRDEVEWDLAAGARNSPELFAQQLCLDAAVSQRHVWAVARAIRSKLVLAQAIAYGDEATREEAFKLLPTEDPLRSKLPMVYSVLEKTSAEHRSRREREDRKREILSAFVKPLIDSVMVEADRRTKERKRKAAEEKARKEAEELKRRRDEEIAKRKAELEKGLKEAEEEAVRVFKERNLDFRPYLLLEVARGERPSLYLPPAFDRRRRKQLTFPMVQQGKRGVGVKGASSSRVSKRRRSSVRRGEVTEDDGETAAKRKGADDGNAIQEKKERPSIPLKLRIKAPVGHDSLSEKKPKWRRRR